MYLIFVRRENNPKCRYGVKHPIQSVIHLIFEVGVRSTLYQHFGCLVLIFFTSHMSENQEERSVTRHIRSIMQLYERIEKARSL